LPQLRELADAPAFTLIDMQQLGEDVRLRLRPRAAAGG
jgi:diaminohydroxyphosphoribosylaminopyrimidine deaminase/5-amino-6-(5-phosphoribosylamino)uracil reductase